jgi:chitin disaccharide deacetylase
VTSHPIKEVVLCADDYALNAPVSQGIVALAVLGRLSATSVMSLSPRWAEDVVALRDVRDRLDVGVHLDWTSHFAESKGMGGRLAAIKLRAALRLCKPQNIEEQIEHQLDAFEAQWQAPPDHIDSHQHVHQLPVFRQALMRVLMRRYGAIRYRPWLRVSSAASPLQKLARSHAWPMACPVLGDYGFNASMDDYGRHMQGWLANAPSDATALIMCNPAVSAQADDPLGNTRKREFAYLAGHDFVQHLVDASVRVVRGSGKPMLPV